MGEAARATELRREADLLEVIDRLDKLQHTLGKVVDDPKVARLEPWLSKRDLAQALGVSPKWVQERIAEGLPHRTIAGAHKFRLSTSERWLVERGLLVEVTE